MSQDEAYQLVVDVATGQLRDVAKIAEVIGQNLTWLASPGPGGAIDEEGEPKAADPCERSGGLGYAARDLAYRLYSICERLGWAEDALGYNLLVTSWPWVAPLAAGSAA